MTLTGTTAGVPAPTMSAVSLLAQRSPEELEALRTLLDSQLTRARVEITQVDEALELVAASSEQATARGTTFSPDPSLASALARDPAEENRPATAAKARKRLSASRTGPKPKRADRRSQSAHRQDSRGEVLEIISASEEPLRPARILDELHSRGSTIRPGSLHNLLSRMVGSHDLVRLGVGRYGAPSR